MLEVITETVISGKEHLVGILGNGSSLALCLITKAPLALVLKGPGLGIRLHLCCGDTEFFV